MLIRLRLSFRSIYAHVRGFFWESLRLQRSGLQGLKECDPVLGVSPTSRWQVRNRQLAVHDYAPYRVVRGLLPIARESLGDHCSSSTRRGTWSRSVRDNRGPWH